MRTYNTKQAVFDVVWDHFVVKKNPKSLHEDLYCIYGGTGCAIGCLIDDKELCQKIDNKYKIAGDILRVLNSNEFGPQLNAIFKFRDSSVKEKEQLTPAFLRRLQAAHDLVIVGKKSSFNEVLKGELMYIASEENVKTP